MKCGYNNTLFKARYNIIGAAAVAKAKNDKAAGQAVMDIVKLDKDKYRLGHTKVFFRAGIGGWMEEQRENKIGSVLAWLQAGARGKASRMQFKKLQDQVVVTFHYTVLLILALDRNWRCTRAKGPSVPICWQKPGSGSRSGC